MKRTAVSFINRNVPPRARDAFSKDVLGGWLAGVYLGCTGPFVCFVARSQLNASPAMIALISAAPYIGCILTLFYANLMEGKTKMPFVVWAGVIGRGLFISLLFVKTPFLFALIVALANIICGLSSPAYAIVVKEIYPDNYRGTLMAYVRVLMTLALFITTMIGGKLLQTIGYGWLFTIGAIFGVASSLIFGKIKIKPLASEETNTPRTPFLTYLNETFKILKHDRRNRRFAIAVTVFGMGSVMVLPLYPIFQVDRIHITATQIAILTNISTFVWMISYPFWGKYIDSRGPIKAYSWTIALSVFLPINYFVATQWWHVIPGTLISGLTIAGMELGFFNSLLHLSKENLETRYQALHTFILGVRGTICSFLGAFMITSFRNMQIDVKYIFIIASILMLYGTYLITQIDDTKDKELI